MWRIPKPKNTKINIRWQFSYVILLFLFLFISSGCLSAATDIENPNPLRFQKEIKRFNWQDAKNSYPEHALLFVGSSSIYRWKTAVGFPHQAVINRGIPGAEISDLNYYFTDLIDKYRAEKIIFYCGDNDVAAGKSSAQILADFQTFMSRLKNHQPGTPLLFLAIKPSPLRWQLWDKMSMANQVIKNYCKQNELCTVLDTATPLLNSKSLPDKSLFAEDGLHLNADGYTIWNNLLTPYLMKTGNQQL